MEVFNYSNYHIHVKILETFLKTQWFFVGFYGILETHKSVDSWELLSRINQDGEKPCCLIGDFNEIYNQAEKSGRRIRPGKKIEDFQKALDINGLFDVGWTSQLFT